MKSSEIRSKFLEFFEAHGHTVVPSSSLVPAKDPTLLFTNSGMVQFKDVFLGRESRSYTRATTAQKCMRAGGKHNDLENVGPSARHLTFFEMLGNFSFGDYFKREAIGYAWEFVTQVLGLEPSRLWATVHYTDDEAASLWQEVAGLPESRIIRMGDEDNFWQMADVGPCGPNSEIFYDRGPEKGCGDPNCTPAHDCGRFWEFWNLVFMQYYQDESGNRTPLPKKNIDTGLGLERTSAIMQGVDSIFETDLFVPIMDEVQRIAGHTDEDRLREIVAYRVIADHSRSLAFLIADGVTPGNEGRSYVLRRIIRRAIRFGRRIGIEGHFLSETARVVVDIMGHHYTELEDQWSFIDKVTRAEEEHFSRTLARGVAQLDDLIDKLSASGQKEIPGGEAFRLYDTYGFPLDLTLELARDRGFLVDIEGFKRAMERQRAQSRAASTFTAKMPAAYAALSGEPTQFTGYTTLEDTGRVVAIIREGEIVDKVEEGQEAEILLDRTPFYAEAGGQVGDTGVITGPEGDFHVLDTQRPVNGYILHRGRVLHGSISVGQNVDLVVEARRRQDIMRNHTATHILHKTLRDVLGPHARQAGSLVAPDRLRFDFTHPSQLSDEEFFEIERIINDVSQDDRKVYAQERPYTEAIASGAMALFGEKYGDIVRVVSIEDYGSELCGGTHVHHTGEIGPIYLTSEGSIASGVRRIEAVTGRGAIRYARERMELLDRLGSKLKVPTSEIERQVALLQERLREQERQIEQLRRRIAAGEIDQMLRNVRQVDGTKLLVAQTSLDSREAMSDLADRLKDRLRSGVVVVGSVLQGKPSIVAVVTPDLVQKGVHAGKLVKEISALVGGGGGGRPDRAEAGGRFPEKLEEALGSVDEVLARQLEGK